MNARLRPFRGALAFLVCGFLAVCSAPGTTSPPLIVHYDGMITVPDDMTQISYPSSYTQATVGSVDITDPYCGVSPTTISFPASYMGSHALPTPSGYPLAANILRGYALKDDWQDGLTPGGYSSNPTFNIGCGGDMQTAFARTIARVKAAHGDYISIDQWTYIDDSNPSQWTIASPESLQTSTISDADLTWAVAQIHAAGLSAHLQIQIQSDISGQTPATTLGNVNLFLAAYGDYVVGRAQLAQRLGIDAMSLVYTGKLWAELDAKFLANGSLATYVDYVQTVGFYNDPTVIQGNIANLSVAEIKSQLSNYISYVQANAPATKPLIVSIGAASRADYFDLSYYVEETACVPSGGSPCVEQTKATDFSLQAIVYEGMLEAITQGGLNLGGVETAGYWLVDGVLPDQSSLAASPPQSTFPNLAFSVRNKPAEALLNLWYSK